MVRHQQQISMEWRTPPEQSRFLRTLNIPCEQNRAAPVGDAQDAGQSVGLDPHTRCTYVVWRLGMQHFKLHAVPIPALSCFTTLQARLRKQTLSGVNRTQNR